MNKTALIRTGIWICIAVAAGIVLFVLPSSKGASPTERTKEAFVRLRELHQAMAMYQEQQGAVPASGNFAAMRLPTLLPLSKNVLNLPPESYVCPCYVKTTQSLLTSPYFDYWIEGDANEILDDNYPLFTSLDCNKNVKTIGVKRLPHRGIGITVSGKLIDITRPGDVTDPNWWHS